MILGDAPYPIIDSLKQIGPQWHPVALHDLQDGERQFNKLKRSASASSRTSSRVLDDLREHDFANRRTEGSAPVAMYYSLTDRGASLCPVFDEMQEWVIEWSGAGREESAEGETVQSTT